MNVNKTAQNPIFQKIILTFSSRLSNFSLYVCMCGFFNCRVPGLLFFIFCSQYQMRNTAVEKARPIKILFVFRIVKERSIDCLIEEETVGWNSTMTPKLNISCKFENFIIFIRKTFLTGYIVYFTILFRWFVYCSWIFKLLISRVLVKVMILFWELRK